MADLGDRINDAENKMHELKGRAKQKNEDRKKEKEEDTKED
jgi:hypothetical protein